MFCFQQASRAFVNVSLLVLALAARGQTTDAAPATVYVKAGHLFDATSDNLRDNVVLVVEGERISKVAPASEVSIPAGASVVDLSRRSAMRQRRGYRLRNLLWMDRKIRR